MIKFSKDGLGLVLGETEIHMTLVELRIIKALEMNPNKVLPREELHKAMRHQFCDSRLVDKHISLIRRKCKEAGGNLPVITVENEGYKWVE